MPPAYPGDSPRPAGGSDPGSFQITASDLGLRACEICVHPLRVESISYSSLHPLKVSTTGLQSKHSGGWFSWCRTPRLGRIMWGSEPSLLWENLCNCNYPPLVGHQPLGMVLDYTTSLPLLPASWFLLSIFTCGRYFSASLQAFLTNSCSVNSYNFGVPVE